MKNTNISISFKPLAVLFKKYHFTLFIVFVTAGLSFAVVSFTKLFTDSSTDAAYTSPLTAGTIDQATLERIKALHSSDDPTPAFTPAAGRIDPFSE